MNQVAPLASQSTNSVAEQKLARLDSFTHLLIRDVRSMVDVRIVMAAANTILLNQQGAGIIGGATINVVQQSLAQSLSLALARIFDAKEGKSLADQDKASVPVLVDLIGDADVQALLTKRIRECFPANADECEAIVTAALQGALGVYDGLLAGTGAQALKSVKEYRNLRMAHMLFHREPQSVPLFGELFLLADAAREFGLHVQRMVTGGRYEWDDEEWELARHAGVSGAGPCQNSEPSRSRPNAGPPKYSAKQTPSSRRQRAFGTYLMRVARRKHVVDRVAPGQAVVCRRIMPQRVERAVGFAVPVIHKQHSCRAQREPAAPVF